MTALHPNVDFSSPFIEASVIAYLDWLRFLWSSFSRRELTTAFVGNVDDMRKMKDTTKDVDLPTVAVAFARLEIDSAKGGGARKFNAINTGIDRDRGIAVMRRMIPVRMGFTVRVRSDQGNDIVRFVEAMLNEYPGYTFYFEDDLNFRVACRLNIDEGYDIPQNDIAGPGDVFTLETVFSMNTYIGRRREQGLIRKIKIDFNEGTGGSSTTIHFDKQTGRVEKLTDTELNYTGPFDSKSSQWKGV